jgi:hypothetical protein
MVELILGVFTAFGLSASAGLNAYIPLLVVALLGRFTNLISLQPPWDALESWWIISLLVVLSIIEFFADKVPAINHVNDILQSFVCPSAGAVVFAASANVITEINPVFSLALGLLVAGGVHTVKAVAVRPMVTATTGGTGNVFISIAEDVISTVVSIMSVVIPAALLALSIFILLWLAMRKSKKTKHIPIP